MTVSNPFIRRFSSRRQPLDRSYLAERLRGALAYDRIAGYFTSSLLEIAAEELESLQGVARVVCNSLLDRRDVETARAARDRQRLAWTSTRPEQALDSPGGERLQTRYRRLYRFLREGRLQVRVLPDEAFGLIHGKAGVITLADGSRVSFLGSVNESRAAWQLNYELLWEDRSAEAVAWVQEEFDALWHSLFAVELADAVVEDIERLAKRRPLYDLAEWLKGGDRKPPEPAAAVIETPLYRQDLGLWEHQKYFVQLAYHAHHGPYRQARFILADQVGLGKTLQLAAAALLIALTGEKPILILAPKALLWQWQTEMRDLLEMPSAVWNGRQWVDENGLAYPNNGIEAILKCPRRVGVVSTGLITRVSQAAELLLGLEYDCVILDEAHRARRRNLNQPEETAEPNNLLAFMEKIAARTRSLLLATATPVQIHPVEVWDLLKTLAVGNEFVLGNPHSRWRHAEQAARLITTQQPLPQEIEEQWEWLRNPVPPREESSLYEILRRNLQMGDSQAVAPGDRLSDLRPSDFQRIQRGFADLVVHHNPLIRHVIRRTREQLEQERDPQTGEPLLPRVRVQLFGESREDSIPLSGYLWQAYQLAEEFCRALSRRQAGSGFLETLLLRRIGSSIYAGQRTVEKILGRRLGEEESEEEDDLESEEVSPSRLAAKIGQEERTILESLWQALHNNRERDPKYARVRHYLFDRGWLRERGCIVFSQYRDSTEWLARQLRDELPDEPIGVYAGGQNSGWYYQGEWRPAAREAIKRMVFEGRIRLLIGTDAASEGLNLQQLGSLINLDLPWNPTRLEQRKGRIQRIGQRFETVYICNLRYSESVEDRVHDLLSDRLEDIYNLFGQIPDVLEDVWIKVAEGEREAAARMIEALPRQHPFEIRYRRVEKIGWETCAEALQRQARIEPLLKGWREKG